MKERKWAWYCCRVCPVLTVDNETGGGGWKERSGRGTIITRHFLTVTSSCHEFPHHRQGCGYDVSCCFSRAYVHLFSAIMVKGSNGRKRKEGVVGEEENEKVLLFELHGKNCLY